MRSILLVLILFACHLLAVAQSPFKPQLAIPVHFSGVAKPVANTERQLTNTFLSGIALLFLDTVNTADELLVTEGSNLIVWHDNVGRSTKVTFIVPDNQFIGRLELMYFGSKCTADLWWQDRNTSATLHATGKLLTGEDGYSLHFTIPNKADKLLGAVFHPLNAQLMQLHAHDIRKVAVKSWFNKDSINVIVGVDSQFDTDYDLFWLDQSLRSRLQTVASNSYSKLFLFTNPAEVLNDSIATKNKLVINHAKRTQSGVKGTLTITMKPDDSARYIFLKYFHSYTLFVDYAFVHVKNRPGELSIQRFGLRDLDTGDFVEMDLYDFVNSGMPVMYVDLIRGVVTSDDGTWDITNVIHAIEDVVEASALPGE